MRKKLFTLLLAMVASVGTMFAIGGTCGANLTWNLTDGVMTISGTGAMTNYAQPSHTPWYNYRSSISSIVIEDGATSIGNNAFSGCNYLSSVTIPNSVVEMGWNCFEDCRCLTSVTIPNSVTKIGDWAFGGCNYLTSVTISNSATYIGNAAFVDCYDLISIEIPNSVTFIGDNAFRNCSGLTSAMIGNSVTSIGSYAFSGCNKLTSVTCKATTPPTLYDYVFDVYFNDVPLYVPAASVETYKATSQWNNFDVQPINTEAIPSVFGTSANHSHKFFKDGQLIIEKNCKTYTIQGQEVK